MKHALLVLASLAVALPASARTRVLVVGPDGPFAQIHEAVAAALPGDTILVKPGTYEAFHVDGKSLIIQGDPRAEVWNLVLPPIVPGDPGPAVSVSGLGASQRVTLRGLDIRLSYAEPVPGLLVDGCAGPVLVEDCAVGASNGRAVTAQGSQSVSVTASTLTSFGPFLPNGAPTHEPNAGLAVVGSNVYLYDCDVYGSAGYDRLPFVSEPPSDGGPGALVSDGFLYASGSRITGGQGGDFDDTVPLTGCEDLGAGGPGLVVEGEGSRVLLLDTPVAGGAGGEQPEADCPLPDGSPGPGQVVAAGTVTPLPGAAHSFRWDSPVRELNAFSLTYTGTPGHFAFLALSDGLAPGLFFEPFALGLHFDLGAHEWVFRGIVPASGTFTETFLLPPLGGAARTSQLAGQVVFIEPGTPFGAFFTSGPSALTMVDAAF